jgi:hypothetical protein
MGAGDILTKMQKSEGGMQKKKSEGYHVLSPLCILAFYFFVLTFDLLLLALHRLYSGLTLSNIFHKVSTVAL